MVMVDTINQTLWVYEFAARGPAHSQLKLWAARSWRYDRKLGQYNTAAPKPEQIKQIVLKQLQQQKKVKSDILKIYEPNENRFER
jgi:hypothetical protein